MEQNNQNTDTLAQYLIEIKEKKKRGRKKQCKDTSDDEQPKAKPKAKADPRERKIYMQQYYQKSKSDESCIGCGATFSCLRALKHHESSNMHCMLIRLQHAWASTQEHIPDDVKIILDATFQQIGNIKKKKKHKMQDVKTLLNPIPEQDISCDDESPNENTIINA